MIFDTEPNNWKELQDFVGQMYRECGFETEVSKVVDLVRGKKEIDVYTQDNSSEYKPIILVECKFWNSSISQETIHSFRTVVGDFGANIGFIVAKNGFQSGSYEAVRNTNIRLVTLKELEREYYSKWKQNLAKHYMAYADRLFPNLDYAGKMPVDGGTIDFDKQQLLYSAYSPICSLGPDDLSHRGFVRNYPMTLPVVNDELVQTGTTQILTDRQYFDFVESKKDEALRHFKILYRE
jgi:hypothetical protein